MRVASGIRSGINGTWGFFSVSNIQARMLGLLDSSLSEPTARVCACDLPHFALLQPALFGHTVDMEHQNVRAHNNSEYPDLLAVVRRKYAVDQLLWELVSYKGLVCWGPK